jgi:hypothetical protein
MSKMIALGHTQLQMGTDIQFVPVRFFQSNNTESKDYMMRSHWSVPYPASFCLGANECTGLESARMMSSMIDQIGIAFSKGASFITELRLVRVFELHCDFIAGLKVSLGNLIL